MPDREHKLRGSDPRLNEPRRRGDTRVLDLKSGMWQWKVGQPENSTQMIYIYAPDGKRTDVPVYEVLGVTKAEWETATYADREDMPITPKDVSDYINETILGRTLEKAS